jgi:hypothetical protein
VHKCQYSLSSFLAHTFARPSFHTLTSEVLRVQNPVDTYQIDDPSPEEVVLATRTMHVVEQLLGGGTLLYGRVDLVRDGDQLYLMELELTEPVLHLEYSGAGERLTEAIVTHSWPQDAHKMEQERVASSR